MRPKINEHIWDSLADNFVYEIEPAVLGSLDSTSPRSKYANELICIITLGANKGLMG